MNKQLLNKNATLIIILAFLGLSANAQDAISWTLRNNGSKVADTIALEDYLPITGGMVYHDVVIELPGITKQELFYRAKLAIQKTFSSSKIGSSNYDIESGIVNINNFCEISDITALSLLNTLSTNNSIRCPLS